jgi:hypothetical protein
MGAGGVWAIGRAACPAAGQGRQGKASVHPIRGYELRMLTALRKAFPDNGYVFNH